MINNFGRVGGPQPALHQPYDLHPHGPFSAVLAPSLIVRGLPGYSPDLSLVLLQKAPDVDGARGVILDHPRHHPIPVQLHDQDRTYFVVSPAVRFVVDGGPPVAGVGLINKANDLEAFGLLSGKGYFNKPPEEYIFPANSIVARKAITLR